MRKIRSVVGAGSRNNLFTAFLHKSNYPFGSLSLEKKVCISVLSELRSTSISRSPATTMHVWWWDGALYHNYTNFVPSLNENRYLSFPFFQACTDNFSTCLNKDHVYVCVYILWGVQSQRHNADYFTRKHSSGKC